MGSTYGTWLRGDPRGWRAYHHREHVDGDYKNPPPAGTYDRLFAQSKRSMKRDEVLLDWNQRVVACREMGKTLLYHKVELIDLSVGAAHFHLLARFTPLGQSPGIQIPGRGDPASRGLIMPALWRKMAGPSAKAGSFLAARREQ